MTVNTVIPSEMMKARGKLVRSQAVLKLAKVIGLGQSKPLPAAACWSVFSDIATAKYKGMRTVSVPMLSRVVVTQLGRSPLRSLSFWGAPPAAGRVVGAMVVVA